MRRPQIGSNRFQVEVSGITEVAGFHPRYGVFDCRRTQRQLGKVGGPATGKATVHVGLDPSTAASTTPTSELPLRCT